MNVSSVTKLGIVLGALAGALWTLLPSSTALSQTDSVSRLNRISQTLRGGKLLEPDLVRQVSANPASINIEEKVDEWLASPDFYATMETWYKQIFRTPWLLNSDIEFLDQAPPGLRQSLAEEPVRLAMFVLQNDMPWSELLQTRLAMRNSLLERWYAGTDLAGAATNDWRPVWRAEHESGVLTLRSMHLRNPTTVVNRWRTHANQVLEQWACQTLHAVDVPVKEDDEAHGTDPNCVSCHRPLDGLGTFFARWDRAGNYNSSPTIDDRGFFYETTNKTHAGNGLKDLGKILGESRRYAQCVIDKTWEFLAGKSLTDADAKTRTDLMLQFWQSDYNLKKLIRAIVLSEEFQKK